MRRQPNPGDLIALAHVSRRVAEVKADVVHGHGAKGGAYARLIMGNRRAVRVYTPHGGSLLFGHHTLAGKFYLTTERFLMPRSDLFLFESAYSADMFLGKIGKPNGLVRIVHNGVSRAEFEPVAAGAEATDLIYLGELRAIKGIDVLIDAIAQMLGQGRKITATLVGDGPERAGLQAQAMRLGLGGAVRFMPAMAAREAFALGRIMVVPSRHESLPYVVLEAAAARKPLIVTQVGGIPEIYGSLSNTLIPPDDRAALVGAISQALDRPDAMADITHKLRERVKVSFSVESMVDGVLAGYRDALAALVNNGRR
jgi:glycosyltransferase involved in cell wall biosynthesis